MVSCCLNITNVLPLRGRVEEGIAAFPEEIPRRLIRLFSYVGETILDPFLGSGTTMKVAKELNRNCWGYEIDLDLKRAILDKTGLKKGKGNWEVVERRDARRLRSSLQSRVPSSRLTKKKISQRRRSE